VFELIGRDDWFEWTQAACISAQAEGEGERLQREIERQRNSVNPGLGAAQQTAGVKL
jgi:hypothetical protein